MDIAKTDAEVGLTDKIRLGDYVQDDVGTQWHAIQRIEHFATPGVFRYILKEYCRKDNRSAIVLENGTEFTCPNSAAKMIISILKEKRE